MLDLRQTLGYKNYLSSQGWAVERINNTNYFIKKLPLIGSIMKLQRPGEIDLKIIEKLVKKHRSFQIIIEPKDGNAEDQMRSAGFKLSKNPYLPSKTLQIDLTQNENQIYKNLKRNIKKGIANGNNMIKKYSTEKEIQKFHAAWSKIIGLSRHVPSLESLINLRKSFPKNKSLFLASHNKDSEIIGGVICVQVERETAYYLYGFTSNEGRASLAHAPLLYQGILWAKKQGCKVFDFDGIYDKRFPNKSWLGFTQFKKSFGGYEVEYPGCYTKFRLPLWI